MVWRHLSTGLLVFGVLTLLAGGLLLTLRLFCYYVTVIQECSIIGLKYLLIIPGIILSAAGLLLQKYKDRALSDVDSMLRYHELESHCPDCYTQGIIKSSGLFNHKMECPKCSRQWRILDL